MVYDGAYAVKKNIAGIVQSGDNNKTPYFYVLAKNINIYLPYKSNRKA
jgi:hypothetical protein